MIPDKNRRIREAALGWLTIEISGEHAERLLNLALQQGIELHHIERRGAHKIRARLLLADVYALRPLMRASRCRFRVVKRAGWPFALAWGASHASFIAGALLAALALYLACSFVWRVEVASIYPLTAAEYQRMLGLAEQAGLKPGVLAGSLDLAALSREISAAASDQVFVQVERQGVKAVIRVVRRQDVPAEERPAPVGEIVAACDGLIEDILVRSGMAAVAIGDTVEAGQVLVYGISGDKLTAASALITARVWGEGEGAWPLVEQGYRPGGAKSEGLLLRFGGNDDGDTAPGVWLWGDTPSYEHFSQEEQAVIPVLWRNMALPVELILNTWYEQEPYVTSYSREQALYHATAKAAAAALTGLPQGADVVEQRTLELQESGGMARVRVTYEARADIGQFCPLAGERLAYYEQMLRDQQQQQQQQ